MCPACGSKGRVLLGDLGARRWFRCRACGIDFSRHLTRPDREQYDREIAHYTKEEGES